MYRRGCWYKGNISVVCICFQLARLGEGFVTGDCFPAVLVYSMQSRSQGHKVAKFSVDYKLCGVWDVLSAQRTLRLTAAHNCHTLQTPIMSCNTHLPSNKRSPPEWPDLLPFLLLPEQEQLGHLYGQTLRSPQGSVTGPPYFPSVSQQTEHKGVALPFMLTL